MGIQEYIQQMRNVQQKIIKFIDNDENVEENFDNLVHDLKDLLISENQQVMKDFLHLILNISNNYHRNSAFFKRIERILSLFENEIKNNFSNYDIFNIFKSNKRILLFLFEKQILIPSHSIATTITTPKYLQSNYHIYFFNEFKSIFSEYLINKIDEKDNKFAEMRKYIENNFEEYQKNRENGENEDEICKLIRNDSIDEFITYINSKEISLSSKISSSIYETNPFLIKNEHTLIDYAAFFGSFQIFKYLIINKCQQNQTLWLYAIHGQNPELISYLEDNKIKPQDVTYRECLFESFKCHHEDVSNYLIENLYQKDMVDKHDYCLLNLKYFNFLFLPDDFDDQENIFFYLCKYGQVILTSLFLKIKEKNINSKLVFFYIKILCNFNLIVLLMSFKIFIILMEFK